MVQGIAGRIVRFLTGRMTRAVSARCGMSSHFRILEQSRALGAGHPTGMRTRSSLRPAQEPGRNRGNLPCPKDRT